MILQTEEQIQIEKEFLSLLGTDHIEFYVGNAKQSAYFYEKTFGFEIIAYRGPETGNRESVSYLLQQGKIRLLLTATLKPNSEIAKHVYKHGDGVKVLALTVNDAEDAYYQTTKRGATGIIEPITTSDKYGTITMSSIKTYGETIHTFVERKKYNGIFLPGFMPRSSGSFKKSVGLKYIDHCVGNVSIGEMDNWVKFYEEVMGFKLLLTFDDHDISTEYTALMSKVVSNGNGYIKFPINEPADGLKKSQIEEYLDFYQGAGVQHIAVATDDIISTVTDLRSRGVEFLYVPPVYYDDLIERVGDIKEDIEEIKALNVLVDRDEDGYLLQIFTKPVEDRPTLFFEIIQRRGAQSFGKGNFKALFEALEREQDLRENL
jgi:4-hydroxyphenylpyruvate dioxygenase